MSRLILAQGNAAGGAQGLELSVGDYTVVGVVAAVALAALAVGAVLMREVLSAGEAPPRCRKSAARCRKAPRRT